MRVIFLALMFLGVAGGPRMGAAQELNACGCYRGSDGNCICTKTKKVKCACAGDCEPIGCEAQRRKQDDKEASAELKRIAAEQKRKSAEAAKQQKARARAKAKAKTDAEAAAQ